MANKVLVGVGIGCGAVVLAAVVAVVAGGLWVKSKVGGVVEASKALQAQQRRSTELDRKYPFDAPKRGEPLALNERRLQEYLGIRESIVPIYKGFEIQAKEFDKHHKNDSRDLSAGLEAVGMTAELFTQVRTKWMEELERHAMSPREYGTITGTVYASQVGRGMAQMQRAARPGLESAIAQLEKQKESPNLSPEQQKMIDQQLPALRQQLAALPKDDEPSAEGKVWETNAALLDKYKVQLEKDGYAALDVFLVSADANDGMQDAFKQLQEAQPQNQ